MLLGVGILLYLGRDQLRASVCSVYNGLSFCQAEEGGVAAGALGGPGFINKLYGPEGYGGPGKSGGGGCTNTEIVQGRCSPAKFE